MFTEPPCLDSRMATDISSFNVLVALFEGLTRFGPDHKPYPAGAESIDISDDQQVYTFHLRESYWSNGMPVTAHDYAETWRQVLDPKFPAPFAYEMFIVKNGKHVKMGELPPEALGLEVVDEKTLVVTLEHPCPYFLDLCAASVFFPLNQTIVGAESQWATESGPLYTCNGPFQLDKWKHESELLLTPNPHYWDREHVHLDGLQLVMVDDATTEFYMFEMNELDWAGSPLSNIPPEFIPGIQKQLNTYDTTAVYFLTLNTNHFPLHNQNIRQALGLAINRSEIITHLMEMEQGVALSLVPDLPGWERPLTAFQDADVQKAKLLFEKGLREEGLTVETFPNLTLAYNTSNQHQKVMQAIQQQWKALLGIQVELEVCDWKVYLSKVNSQNYDIARFGWVGQVYDPISYLEIFKKDNENNSTGWHHPTFTALIEAADLETNGQKRADLLHAAELFLMEQMPIIPICHVDFRYLKKPWVHDVYASPLGFVDFKTARIVR